MQDILDIPGYLVTMNIEKVFDYLNHDFPLIKILLIDKKPSVINGYFNLEKGAHYGDPLSAYLFILALEVLFELIKNIADIR